MSRTALEDARATFLSFHRFVPTGVRRARCRRMMPAVLVELGALRGLIYSADRNGCGRAQSYIHFMDAPPMLACDPSGTQLYIVGGRYRVTARGIEG